MRLTEEEAKALGFKKDGKGNWQTDIQRSDSGKVPELESDTRHEPKRKTSVQSKDEKSSSCRYRIVVTAHYRRDVDYDNPTGKWFVDQLVIAGVIPDDSSRYVAEGIMRVRKIEKWEPETTMIEVWEL